MDTKQKLITLSLILGTTGLCLFLLEKMNIVKGKLFNYIGKGLIVVGVYLLAIGSIITRENYDQLLDKSNILSNAKNGDLSIDNTIINSAYNKVQQDLQALDNNIANTQILVNINKYVDELTKIQTQTQNLNKSIEDNYSNAIKSDQKVLYTKGTCSFRYDQRKKQFECERGWGAENPSNVEMSNMYLKNTK